MSWLAALTAAQALALVLLAARLRGGRKRSPAIAPLEAGLEDTTVSVLLPTLNEGKRIGPCLDGLARQRAPLTEIVVIDSGSADDTVARIAAARSRDPRFRIVDDRPLPDGWIGKVWALEKGRG